MSRHWLRGSICAYILFSNILAGQACSEQLPTLFAYPIDEWKETCNFTNVCLTPNHLGDDAVPQSGAVIDTIVRSPASGVVKEAQFHNNYGGTVIIQAYDGQECVTILLAHLRWRNAGDLLVTPGPISIGTPIGRIAPTGENGADFGPHLHVGIHKGAYSSMNIDCALNPRNKEWVYAGRTYCPATVFPQWYNPSDFIQSRLTSLPPAIPPDCPQTVSDGFNRPDGSVGNGWTNTTGNANGNLLIRSGALSTPGPNGRAGIYRPINLSPSVTVSATLTQENGFGGLLNRYDTSLLFGSDGSLSSGYGVSFYRADQNYTSSVRLIQNGTDLASRDSSFQFGASIAVAITFNHDGSITGSVTGNGSTFNFSFAPRTVTLQGTNLSIIQGFPDGNSGTITNPTIDNITIAYSCASHQPAVKVPANFTGNRYLSIPCSALPDAPVGYRWFWGVSDRIWDNWSAVPAFGGGFANTTKPCSDNTYVIDVSDPSRLIPNGTDVYFSAWTSNSSAPIITHPPWDPSGQIVADNIVYYGIVHWTGSGGTVK